MTLGHTIQFPKMLFLTGAGVTIIEDHQDLGPCFLLFNDKTRGKISDAGGGIDHGETITRTAVRELQEESRNVFRIAESTLNVSYCGHNDTYIIYFIYVQGPINNDWYYHNMKIIDNQNTPPQWKETDSIVRVSLKQFLHSGGLTTSGDLNTIDTKGNHIQLFERTKSCIRNWYQTIGKIQLHLKQKIKIQPNNNYTNRRIPFLNGTKTYFTT